MTDRKRVLGDFEGKRDGTETQYALGVLLRMNCVLWDMEDWVRRVSALLSMSSVLPPPPHGAQLPLFLLEPRCPE